MLLAINPSTIIIVSAPVRNQATTDSFFSTCSERCRKIRYTTQWLTAILRATWLGHRI